MAIQHLYVTTTLACGNCVYYAMWHKFPPTNSWVVIIPLWFVLLSAIRTFSNGKLWAIPTLHFALPIVIVVGVIAPGMIGPPLGFWIPICCIAGTVSAISNDQSPLIRKRVLRLTGCVLVALVAFAACDYVAYNNMSAKERAKFTPVWEREPKTNAANNAAAAVFGIPAESP